MKDGELNQELAQDSARRDTVRPGDAPGGTIPGDMREGMSPMDVAARPDGRVDQAELDAEMEEREAALEPQGAGVLRPGVHVGTPAGGVTDAAEHGSGNYGRPREETSG